jgi:hypothetical protein
MKFAPIKITSRPGKVKTYTIMWQMALLKNSKQQKNKGRELF